MRLVRLQCLQLGIVQLDFERGNSVVQMAGLAGAEYGRGDAGLLCDPGQRDLRVRNAPIARPCGQNTNVRE